MLGHRLLMGLSQSHEVRVTLRGQREAYRSFPLFTERNAYWDIDARAMDRVRSVLKEFKPDAAINAVGLVKQRADGLDPIPNLEINALLPHYLAAVCSSLDVHFVHISTDCVFSGRRGNYREDDEPDPIDVYGHSKLLGEVVTPGCITLRTSIIGFELARKTSLLEWFLSQKGRVYGFKNAMFSGFTTLELSRIMQRLITHFPESSGIYHVSSYPISKYDLLNLIKRELGLQVQIDADTEYRCDRTLDSTRFRRDFGYQPPTWEQMIRDLAQQYAYERPLNV
jgi:dTDP-4-dehydrorhamnose reductase